MFLDSNTQTQKTNYIVRLLSSGLSKPNPGNNDPCVSPASLYIAKACV